MLFQQKNTKCPIFICQEWLDKSSRYRNLETSFWRIEQQSRALKRIESESWRPSSQFIALRVHHEAQQEFHSTREQYASHKFYQFNTTCDASNMFSMSICLRESAAMVYNLISCFYKEIIIELLAKHSVVLRFVECLGAKVDCIMTDFNHNLSSLTFSFFLHTHDICNKSCLHFDFVLLLSILQ